MQILYAWLFHNSKNIIPIGDTFHTSHESILKRDWTFFCKQRKKNEERASFFLVIVYKIELLMWKDHIQPYSSRQRKMD